jgi:adenylosuccinate synthase
VNGKRTDDMPMTQSDIVRAEPIYEEMPGWWEDISEARDSMICPQRPRDYVLRLEELAEAHVSCIAGPGREQTIVRRTSWRSPVTSADARSNSGKTPGRRPRLRQTRWLPEFRSGATRSGVCALSDGDAQGRRISPCR